MGKMDVRTYVVAKSRIGQRGAWDSWKYAAREENSHLNVGDRGPRPLGAGSNYETLDSLAKELAELPQIEVAEFTPGVIVKEQPTVSICDRSLTQWAPISDEELGQLASLVQKYFYESRE